MKAIVRRAYSYASDAQNFTYLSWLGGSGDLAIEYGYRPAAHKFDSFVEAAEWVDAHSTSDKKFEIVSA